jgi:hypothetical protein
MITIVQPLIKQVGIQTKYDRNNGYILCNQVLTSLNIYLVKPNMRGFLCLLHTTSGSVNLIERITIAYHR